MAPQQFENLMAREQAIIQADYYAEMTEDLKEPEVQQALQIDPVSETRWQARQDEDIDFAIGERNGEVNRMYDETPTFANWFQLPKTERMRRLAERSAQMA